MWVISFGNISYSSRKGKKQCVKHVGFIKSYLCSKHVKKFVPTPTDLQQPRIMVIVPKVRYTYEHFDYIFGVPIGPKREL